ncbi:MAG: PspC domain-containing protein [Archangium sp.]
MHRDIPGRMVAGVAASIAQHFNWDVTLVRVVLVLSVAFTGGLVFWLYAAAWALMPFAPGDKAPFARLIDGIGSVFSPPPRNVEKV